MDVDAEDSSDLDVQDFRLWWERGPPRKATEGRSRVWKLTATMLVFVGLASIVILALRGGGSTPPKGLPVVATVNSSATMAPDDGAPFRNTLVDKEQSAEPRDAGVTRFAPRSAGGPARGCSVDSATIRARGRDVELAPAGCAGVGSISRDQTSSDRNFAARRRADRDASLDGTFISQRRAEAAHRVWASGDERLSWD